MRTIERKIKFVIFGFSVIILLFLFYKNDFGITSQVAELHVTEEDYQELKDSRTESNLENTFEIKVDDYTLPYDETTNSFMYTIDAVESINENNPKFEIVMENNFDYEVALMEQSITKEMIDKNEPIKLLVYSNEKFDEYNIYLTTLPIVNLSLENFRDDNRPIGNENQLASMSLFDSNELVESDLYIRLRGATSCRFPKNQYRINLRELTIGGEAKLNHQSLLGMREDDDWILYSPYNDPEKVRNTLSNNLWHDTMAQENRFDINTGAEGEYVEVFMNNRYWGLYTLMHPIDAKQLDMDLENQASESEIYYRTISYQNFVADDFENSTGNEKTMGRFELREPDEPFGDPKQWEPISEHMMMQNQDVETLENYLLERTDIQNQINYYLFIILLQATDNNFKNHNYISKFDEDTRIMLESPWDLDLTWGLRWHPQHPRLAIVKGTPDFNHTPTASLIYTAIHQESTKVIEMVKEKYWTLRADEWSEEAFMEMLDEYEEDIYGSGAILRDKERWPDTAYNENMDYLRNYILERLIEMDQFIEQEI